MILPEPAQAAVWQCLNHYNFKDAIFLAERINAEVRTDESLHLLATCHYRAGKPNQAYMILKQNQCTLPQGQFLLAKCCFELNKLAEAESAILGNALQKHKAFDEVADKYEETAAFVFQLLGKIYSKTERKALAAECYRRSLKLNTFLWSSFEALCDLDDSLDPAKVFQTPSCQQISLLCQSPMLRHASPMPASTLPPSAAGDSGFTTPVTSTLTMAGTPDLASQWNTPATTVTPSVITPQLANSPEENTTPNNPIPSAPPTAPRTNRHKQSQLAVDDDRPRRVYGQTEDSKVFYSPSFGYLSMEGTPNYQITTPVFQTPSPGIPEYQPSSRLSNVNKDTSEKIIEPFKAPSKKPATRRQQQLSSHNRVLAPPVFSQSTNINTSSVKDSSDSGQQPAPLRRSSRLFHSASGSSVKENNNKAQNAKAPVKKTRGKLTRGTTATINARTQQAMNELNREKSEQLDTQPQETVQTQHNSASDFPTQVLNMQKQSAENLVSLLQKLGQGYLHLHRYNCHKALEHFSSLPPQQYHTAWVLSQVGRAHFELAEYQNAERVFSELRQTAPYQVEGLEYFSTALWHLQRDVQLAMLAQELSHIDKLCPETWCCLGNCFSLQKEHDIAIRYLQRAIQVAPDFAYAHTLLGHEYVLTEELDKAMNCFRSAVRVDAAHYNAWYGMGMIYYKQEKFNLAETHYRKAVMINPQSSVLLCHIGVVQHALKKSDHALVTLDKAISADPKNPLCKFHRASILFASEKFDESLKELEELKQIIPKESLVYFLMGKVHKKLGNTDLALMNFSWAMDLDPKGANNQIKEAIDKRYVTDDEDFGGGFESSPELNNSQESSAMEGDEAVLAGGDSDESL